MDVLLGMMCCITKRELGLMPSNLTTIVVKDCGISSEDIFVAIQVWAGSVAVVLETLRCIGSRFGSNICRFYTSIWFDPQRDNREYFFF